MKSLLFLLLACATAHANTPEDTFGASARTIAMGGAGVALPGDYASVHYNPAGLTSCETSDVDFDVSYISHHLSFTDKFTAAPEPLVPRQVRNQTRFMIGSCLALPFDISAGFMLGLGTPGAISLDQQTANDTPDFVMYGKANEQIVIGTGLAWKVTPQLSVGGGLAILIKSQLPLNANLPILDPDPSDPTGYAPVNFGLGIGMGAMLSPRVGIMYEPSKRLRFGAAYRGALYHDLDVDAYITAKLIIEIPVPVHVDSLGWFSPRQLSAGVSGEPVENLTLSGDVTYYRWGELRQNNSSYPFLNMYSLDPEGASGALVFPRPIRSGWKNNVAWRGGAEWRSGNLALRGGVGYRTRGVNLPERSNVNLLDAPVATASAGIAWSKGDTKKSDPPRRWWRYTVPDVKFTADAFVRVDHMLAQTVEHDGTDGFPEKHFEYGGNVLQVGAKATLGW